MCVCVYTIYNMHMRTTRACDNIIYNLHLLAQPDVTEINIALGNDAWNILMKSCTSPLRVQQPWLLGITKTIGGICIKSC